MTTIKKNSNTAGVQADLEREPEQAAQAEQAAQPAAGEQPWADAGNPREPEADLPAPEGNTPARSETWHLPPRKWYFTFMCMNIPIVGWIYLLSKAFGKKENQLKDFCRAYLLYKLVFLVISLVILGALVYVGLELADRVLAYMEML